MLPALMVNGSLPHGKEGITALQVGKTSGLRSTGAKKHIFKYFEG